MFAQRVETVAVRSVWLSWLLLLLLHCVVASLPTRTRNVTTAATAPSSSSMRVSIVSWTTEWEKRPDDKLFYCGHLLCTYSWNLSLVDSASALLVYAPDLQREPTVTELIRDSKQRPLYYLNDEVPHWWTGSDYFQQYDIVSTYDTLCDAPRPYVLSQNTINFIRRIGAEQSDRLRLDPLSLQKEVEAKRLRAIQSGLAPIAWFVSNCGSGRSYLVAELMRHIPVDIYSAKHCLGSNLTTNGTRSTDEDVRLLRSSYLFYLSLENNNCKDYVTEKLSRPLLSNVLPIVDGPDDYSPFLPHSLAAVRADQFSTPAALAQHIRYLTTNLSAYLQHIDMRNLSRAFVMYNERAYDGRCTMCHNAYNAKLHIAAHGMYRRVPTRYRYSRDELCTEGKWKAFNTPDTRIVTTDRSWQYAGPRLSARTWWGVVKEEMDTLGQKAPAGRGERGRIHGAGLSVTHSQQQHAAVGSTPVMSPSAAMCSNSGSSSYWETGVLRWRLTSLAAVSGTLGVTLLCSIILVHIWRRKQYKYGERCKLQADELFTSLVRLWLLCVLLLLMLIGGLATLHSYFPTPGRLQR